MYIFELIAQAFKNKKQPKDEFNPLEPQQDEEYEKCNHLFMPLDSSGEYFACKYCGLVVPKNKLRNNNMADIKNIELP